MRLDSLPPELQPHLERLGAYAGQTVGRAAQFALKLHADSVDVEHLLATLLADEESAAGQSILHAFADPETIRSEVVALCPGILVIGSKRSLPFSVRGVHAMEAARVQARAEQAGQIEPRHLLQAAVLQLPEALRSELAQLGFDPDTERGDGVEDHVPELGPLLKFFDPEARRALSAACRHAVRLERDAISPAHLMMGALEGSPQGLLGVTQSRAQMFLTGRDEDPTALPERHLPFSSNLIQLLTELPDAASTSPMLGWILKNGNPELRGLLDRQRVTLSLLEHTKAAFCDPDPTKD